MTCRLLLYSLSLLFLQKGVRGVSLKALRPALVHVWEKDPFLYAPKITCFQHCTKTKCPFDCGWYARNGTFIGYTPKYLNNFAAQMHHFESAKLGSSSSLPATSEDIKNQIEKMTFMLPFGGRHAKSKVQFTTDPETLRKKIESIALPNFNEKFSSYGLQDGRDEDLVLLEILLSQMKNQQQGAVINESKDGYLSTLTGIRKKSPQEKLVRDQKQREQSDQTFSNWRGQYSSSQGINSRDGDQLDADEKASVLEEIEKSLNWPGITTPHPPWYTKLPPISVADIPTPEEIEKEVLGNGLQSKNAPTKMEKILNQNMQNGGKTFSSSHLKWDVPSSEQKLSKSPRLSGDRNTLHQNHKNLKINGQEKGRGFSSSHKNFVKRLSSKLQKKYPERTKYSLRQKANLSPAEVSRIRWSLPTFLEEPVSSSFQSMERGKLSSKKFTGNQGIKSSGLSLNKRVPPPLPSNEPATLIDINVLSMKKPVPSTTSKISELSTRKPRQFSKDKGPRARKPGELAFHTLGHGKFSSQKRITGNQGKLSYMLQKRVPPPLPSNEPATPIDINVPSMKKPAPGTSFSENRGKLGFRPTARKPRQNSKHLPTLIRSPSSNRYQTIGSNQNNEKIASGLQVLQKSKRSSARGTKPTRAKNKQRQFFSMLSLQKGPSTLQENNVRTGGVHTPTVTHPNTGRTEKFRFQHSKKKLRSFPPLSMLMKIRPKIPKLPKPKPKPQSKPKPPAKTKPQSKPKKPSKNDENISIDTPEINIKSNVSVEINSEAPGKDSQLQEERLLKIYRSRDNQRHSNAVTRGVALLKKEALKNMGSSTLRNTLKMQKRNRKGPQFANPFEYIGPEGSVGFLGEIKEKSSSHGQIFKGSSFEAKEESLIGKKYHSGKLVFSKKTGKNKVEGLKTTPERFRRPNHSKIIPESHLKISGNQMGRTSKMEENLGRSSQSVGYFGPGLPNPAWKTKTSGFSEVRGQSFGKQGNSLPTIKSALKNNALRWRKGNSGGSAERKDIASWSGKASEIREGKSRVFLDQNGDFMQIWLPENLVKSIVQEDRINSKFPRNHPLFDIFVKNKTLQRYLGKNLTK